MFFITINFNYLYFFFFFFFFFFSIYVCAFGHDTLSAAIWVTQAFKHTLQKLYPASLTQFINQAVLSNVFFRCQQWLTVHKLSHALSPTLIEPCLTQNGKRILRLHSLQFNRKWLRYKLHPNWYCILFIFCHTVHNWQAIASDLLWFENQQTFNWAQHLSNIATQFIRLMRLYQSCTHHCNHDHLAWHCLNVTNSCCCVQLLHQCPPSSHSWKNCQKIQSGCSITAHLSTVCQQLSCSD